MRVLLQRVTAGAVRIDGETVGEIGKGLVLLVGFTHGDSREEIEYLAGKCANLRIFEDEGGKMNLSALDVGGEALVISQFTLYGDCVKGRRPGFEMAAKPETALKLYDEFVEVMRHSGFRKIATGRFGADMKVEIHNDGPVTFLLESGPKA